LLFDIAAQTLLRIAADPKHLGAHIGATLVSNDGAFQQVAGLLLVDWTAASN
jgi:hypothetical protein